MASHAHAHDFARSVFLLPAALVLTAVLLFGACDLVGDDEDDPITSIAIVPDSVTMSPGDEVDFSVVGLTETGDTVRDADLDLRWWSTDTTVFTVDESGRAVGQDSGSAYCMVEADDGEAAKRAGKTAGTGLASSPLRFVGRDSALVQMF